MNLMRAVQKLGGRTHSHSVPLLPPHLQSSGCTCWNCTRVHTHAPYTHINIYTFTCVHDTHTHMQIRVTMHAYTHTLSRSYICTRVHTHTHIHPHTCGHTHTAGAREGESQGRWRVTHGRCPAQRHCPVLQLHWSLPKGHPGQDREPWTPSSLKSWLLPEDGGCSLKAPHFHYGTLSEARQPR
jgi:hypothetical protein